MQSSFVLVLIILAVLLASLYFITIDENGLSALPQEMIKGAAFFTQ